MDEEVFNMELRKFLKKVGVTSQREIETAVRTALESGKLKVLGWAPGGMGKLREFVEAVAAGSFPETS